MEGCLVRLLSSPGRMWELRKDCHQGGKIAMDFKVVELKGLLAQSATLDEHLGVRHCAN